MDQDQAKQAIRAGEYVAHSLFTPGESIHSDKDGNVLDENDIILNNFWQSKNHEYWKTGWFVVLQPVITETNSVFAFLGIPKPILN